MSKGDASCTRTFFLLLKSFIGTGVFFLPKAFKNGGMLFSLICLVTVSLASCAGFHLLLNAGHAIMEAMVTLAKLSEVSG